MSEQLDPWDDASAIADRLARPETNLYVVIGAESWCSKCRALRPQFDELAQRAGHGELWLWLDLEEHVDFIGEYVPDDLPMLVFYRGERFIGCIPVGASFIAVAAQPRTNGQPDPGIRARLLAADWVR